MARQCGRPAPTWTRLNKYLQLLRVLSGEHVPSAHVATHSPTECCTWLPGLHGLSLLSCRTADCGLQNMVLGAVQCPAHGRMGTGITDGGSLRYRKGVPQQLGDMQLPCCQTRESLSSGKCCIFCYRLFCHHDCRISTHSNYILIS